jgi:hypothetical protein
MEIVGWMVAVMALILAIDAQSKVGKLEKRLRARGLLDEGAKSDKSAG